MEHLFAYGSLMCADVMQQVAGICPSAEPGTLPGYRIRSVRNERYPAVAPDESGLVSGVVYRDVPAAAWVRLDRFEGEMYVRQRVMITLGNGETLPAVTYVVHPAFADRLEESGWDYEAFLRNGKESLLQGWLGDHWK